METESIKRILEAALLAAGRPLSMNDLEQLFTGDVDAPPRDAIRGALSELSEDWQARSLALQEVASGFRAQVREEFEPWIARLWDEKPPRYSRALLETLAIIAYRQPITRSEIEDIRGVSVSTQIMRTLTEREWVRVVGHRDAPGRPAMYGTTRAFLDHFNLKTLDQLPDLSEVTDPSGQHPELAFEGEPGASAARGGADAAADAGGEDAPVPAEAEAGETAAGADAEDDTAADVGAGMGREPEATAPDDASSVAAEEADAVVESYASWARDVDELEDEPAAEPSPLGEDHDAAASADEGDDAGDDSAAPDAKDASCTRVS